MLPSYVSDLKYYRHIHSAEWLTCGQLSLSHKTGKWKFKEATAVTISFVNVHEYLQLFPVQFLAQ